MPRHPLPPLAPGLVRTASGRTIRVRAMAPGPKRTPARVPRSTFVVERRARTFTAAERRALQLPKGRDVVRDLWCEVEFTPGWRVAYRLVPFAPAGSPEGHPVIAEIRVFPADQFAGRRPGTWRAEVLGVGATTPPAGVTTIGAGLSARLLRQVPIGFHLRHAAEFVREFAEPDTAMRASLLSVGFPEAQPTPQKKGRPPRVPDAALAQLAADYVDVSAASRRPVADLAARHRTTAARMRDLIHAARVRGFLTAGRQGAPGGRLTPRARAFTTRKKNR
jgi:hypothetical protein